MARVTNITKAYFTSFIDIAFRKEPDNINKCDSQPVNSKCEML